LSLVNSEAWAAKPRLKGAGKAQGLQGRKIKGAGKAQDKKEITCIKL
tara:strand:+ start:863 stop:1003 length:141 start_codon:yes stop_codon:yes gene_type:complete